METQAMQEETTSTRRPRFELLRRVLGLRGRRSLDRRDATTASDVGRPPPAPEREVAPPRPDLACESYRFTVESSVFPSITVDATCWTEALKLTLEILEREDRWTRLEWTLGGEIVIASDPTTGERYEVPLQGKGWSRAA